jgi:leucyl aminopeptidase (aminopeptidase T)
MNPDLKAVAAARGAMIHVLKLAPEDAVLVVTDTVSRSCGEAFARAAEEQRCAVELYHLPAENRPLMELPSGMSDRLVDRTVVINTLDGRADEVPFRIAWILAIREHGGIRLGHSPGITIDMMTGGPLEVDYAAMVATADRLIAAFAGATTIHITTAAGTDLSLEVTDRDFLSDMLATEENGVNLPCGEIYCGPVESGADGVLVIDGCLGSYGNVPAPLTMTIAGGRVVGLECAAAEVIAEVEKLLASDDEARVIGELGIGLNPGARLVGAMLEDEKALRTAHIAFGNNEEFPGGQNHSCMHVDYLFHAPTMLVSFADGSQRDLMVNGDLRI